MRDAAGEGQQGASGQDSTSLAAKLNHLFADAAQQLGHELSNEHVAKAIEDRSGVRISQSYLWQLRKGKKDNPTLKHLQALADFFGVSGAYFFDDGVTDRHEDQLATWETIPARTSAEGNQVRLMAMRSGELSPRHRRQVWELLDVVYRLEQAERHGTADG